jgi:hypothetical protein
MGLYGEHLTPGGNVELTALELAKFARLWVSRSDECGHLRLTRHGRIVIGPGVSDDAIATAACRAMVGRELGRQPTEAAVRSRVRSYGFRYVGGVKPLHRATRPPMSARRRSA